MWVDPPLDEQAVTDRQPIEARTLALASAAFAFPVVIIGLTWLEPLTAIAASGFGAG